MEIRGVNIHVITRVTQLDAQGVFPVILKLPWIRIILVWEYMEMLLKPTVIFGKIILKYR